MKKPGEKKGWFLEAESHLGISFKVSVWKFKRRRTHSHNLWLLLVLIELSYRRYHKSDNKITSTITNRIGRHEVLLPIKHLFMRGV